MANQLKEDLHRYVDQMNEYQLRLVLSFIKKLFGLSAGKEARP